MAKEKLGTILIRAGLLDQEGLQRALNEQQRWGGQLGRYLVELDLISEEILVRALSTQYKIPAVSIDPYQVDIAIGRRIDRDICERNSLICFRVDPDGKFLDIAMSDPACLDAIDEVRVATKCNIRPHVAAPAVIDKAINFIFYGEMQMGGELDLGPDSKLRLDSRGSELLKKARGMSPREEKAEAPQLEVNVSVREDQPAPGVTIPKEDLDIGLEKPSGDHPIDLPEPSLNDGFHITMDVPAVDKEELAVKDRQKQLGRIEATVSRNSAILKSLLEHLAHKGIISKQDIRKIITSWK